MRELNIDFMDLYKSVDRFIRDAYSSGEGVSEYIRQMESNALRGRRYVNTWNTDYEDLKHLRWIRNQLSHEIGYDSDICEASDYKKLVNFKSRLYDASDPLSLLRTAEKKERQKRSLEHLNRYTGSGDQQTQPSTNTVLQPKTQAGNRKTLWQRIRAFFRLLTLI